METGNGEISATTSASIYLDGTGRYRSDQARPDPHFAADEVSTLPGFLERQRATFAWACGGLDESGLRTRHGFTEMALGGMLKHIMRFEDDMAAEWMHGCTQIAPWVDIDWETQHGWGWRCAAEDSATKLYGNWQSAVSRARNKCDAALIEKTSQFGENATAQPFGRLPSLRYILLNTIEECARHNRHADLIRESIDRFVGHDSPN